GPIRFCFFILYIFGSLGLNRKHRTRLREMAGRRRGISACRLGNPGRSLNCF
ncbi:hypothetical protein GOODEAATRI_019390, partial [Goodea atripinnis]